MLSNLLLGAIAAAILVVLILAVSQISKLSQSVDRLAESVQRIELAVGSPNGGEPDWPNISAAGVLEANPPAARDHNTVSELLRGIYCGNAYAVQLLNLRLKE